ncbi:MAG: energy-coupling factor ABC transporter ATP-binding protein [Betaproteobacteria bacterium]|jgi:biotin transport system ATP-binding protein
MELRRIHLMRDQSPVFVDLSLSLDGQRIGLIGANGSGKSSLLRLMKGLLTPDSGEVRGSGSVGIVFQNPEHQLLFPTVMEELCFGLRERGCSELEARTRALSVLRDFDALDMESKTVHELSDGQKQLICIFEVLIDGADTVLFDEPCASLDYANRKKVMQIIESLPQQVIMATHDLELLLAFPRVVWLDEGRIRADGPAPEVLTAYRESIDKS